MKPVAALAGLALLAGGVLIDVAAIRTRARRDGDHYVLDGAKAFISGGVVVHQFSKIGRLAMIGGNTRVNRDVPPYFLYSSFDVAPNGLNLVGLRRAGFAASEVAVLKQAYKLLFRSGLKLEDALTRIEIELAGEHVRHLVEFIRSSKRGICRE